MGVGHPSHEQLVECALVIARQSIPAGKRPSGIRKIGPGELDLELFQPLGRGRPPSHGEVA
jgi:hypothetical protein